MSVPIRSTFSSARIFHSVGSSGVAQNRKICPFECTFSTIALSLVLSSGVNDFPNFRGKIDCQLSLMSGVRSEFMDGLSASCHLPSKNANRGLSASTSGSDLAPLRMILMARTLSFPFSTELKMERNGLVIVLRVS